MYYKLKQILFKHHNFNVVWDMTPYITKHFMLYVTIN